MTRTRTILAFAAAAFSVQFLHAAPRVESNISSRFLVRGEQALFQVSVIGARPEAMPVPPSVPGLTILRSELSQLDARPLPGRQISWDYTYQVFSYEPGRHQIPAIDVEVDGRILKSPPLDFDVLGPDDLHWTEVTAGERRVRVAANFRTTKDKPFDGETVPVELKLYVPGDLRVQDWGIPEFGRSKLAVWRFEPNRLLGRATLGGRTFASVSYPSTLTPTGPGKNSVGPAKLRLIVIETTMDSFGLRPFHEEVNLTIPALELEARPLPPGAPEGFRNAVGNFTLGASTTETEIREGDPVSVTLTVSGTGNLDNLSPPTPLDAAGWKVYETAATQRGDERRSESGTVEFRQFMRPLTTQTKIPPFRLVFFDPDREHYRTLLSDPIPLTILPSTRPPDANPQAPAAANVPVERMTDILGLLPTAGILTDQARWPWQLLWQSLPAALLVFLLARIARRHLLPRIRREPERAARRRALAELERSAPADPRAFLRAAGAFVERWLGEQVPRAPELAAILGERDSACFRPDDTNPAGDARRRREVLRVLRRHALPLALLACLWFAGAPAARADSPAAAADLAATAYQESRWADAISLWLSHGPYQQLDANRLYNIGNAWYRHGSPGQAALWWRRTLVRDPSHPEARQNLRFLERKFGSITVNRPAYQHALARVPLATWQSLVWAAGWLVALGLLTFPASRPGARSRLAAVIALVIAPVLAAIGALAWRHYPDDAAFAPLAEQAVITADRAVLFTDASRSSTEVIDAPPGSLCRVVADRGRWLYVSFATRTSGWIPAGQAERLVPLHPPVAPDPAAKPKPASGST